MTRASVLGVRVSRALPHTATPSKRLQSTAVDSFSLSSAHVAPLDELIPRWKSDYSSVPSAAAALAASGLDRLNARETRTRTITWPESASLDAPKALPMPVKIGTDEDFKDVFQFLHKNIDPKDVLSPEKQALRDELARTLGLQPGTELRWNTPMVEFKRGVVYDDGRLDLCKMVVGPTHIEKLLDALEGNTVVTQFLLGNNVMSTTGARRVARFIAEHPERIETWYLAGNHIRAPAFRLLVDAMVQSPRITNVWLKRNPLTPASVPDVVRLITQTPNLRTLDLENTELGDAGVARIMREITGKALPLRNLYLNANGVGEKAAAALGAYLAHPRCALESLYLDSNPLGDAGALHLAAALASTSSTRSLRRLALSSTNLTSTGASALFAALTMHPRLVSLNLDASVTMRVHGQRPNLLDDGAVPALVGLVRRTPALRHLQLGRTAFSAEGLAAVCAAVVDASSNNTTTDTSNLCIFRAYRWRAAREAPNFDGGLRAALAANVRRLYPAEGEDYDAFLRDSLAARFLYSPEDVRLIDSVYRTRDQRGAGAGEQVWRAGDEVWGLVDADV